MKPPKVTLKERATAHVVETHGPFDGPFTAGEMLGIISTMPPHARITFNSYENLDVPNTDLSKWHWTLTADWIEQGDTTCPKSNS